MIPQKNMIPQNHVQLNSSVLSCLMLNPVKSFCAFFIWTLTIELVLIYIYCVFAYVLSVIILCADNGDVRTIMLHALGTLGYSMESTFSFRLASPRVRII